LHGDERGSVDRHHNRYNTPFIPCNEKWEKHNAKMLRHLPVILNTLQRSVVETAIRETSENRNWLLLAVNARTNHIHSVVSASCRPEIVLNAFKSNATHKMKTRECWKYNYSPWSDKGSKRYLWTERSVERAVDYVINGQEGKIPDFNDENG
jgi:REP element-mobilizing transposase RayT